MRSAHPSTEGWEEGVLALALNIGCWKLVLVTWYQGRRGEDAAGCVRINGKWNSGTVGEMWAVSDP